MKKLRHTAKKRARNYGDEKQQDQDLKTSSLTLESMCYTAL